MDAEEGLDVAHVGVGGEEPLDERVVRRHVGELDRQDEVGAGGDAVALAHGVLGHRPGFESSQRLGRLPVESDLDDGREAVAQPLGRKDGDRFLDDPGLGEPLHPSKAGGGGDVHLGGQRLVG